MKNPFRSIREKKVAEDIRMETAQHQRIERLQELESKQAKKGVHIPHPIQAMKDQKEIKTLRKEIAAYDERKRNKKSLMGCLLVMVALFVFIGIMSALEADESPVEATTTLPGIIETTNIEIPATTAEDTELETGHSDTSDDNPSGGLLGWLSQDVPEFEFELNADGQSYTLVDYNGISPDASDALAEIPSTYEGLPVTAIGQKAFYAQTDLQQVIIPEGIVAIEDYAFYHCENLTEIVFPTTLRRIKSYAFEGCDGLLDVNIPWSVGIYFRAFYECDNLQSVTIGNADTTAFIDGYAFHKCKKIETAVLEGVTSLGSNAFSWCDSLKEVYLSKGFFNMGDSAFEYCRSLETIYFNGSREDFSNISYHPWWNKDTGNYVEVYSEDE